MRRVLRIRLYLRHPPFSVRSFVRCIASGVGFLFVYTGQGRFKVLFYSILVLIYAALFTLAGVSALIHECAT